MNKTSNKGMPVRPLADIRNEDGFRFIGIDEKGREHDCIVRFDAESQQFHVSSNTITFPQLIGWVPDSYGAV